MNGGGHAVATDMVVRRLTPIECTRLMGWSDDHLEIGTFDAENEEYARQVVWHLWKVIQSSEIQRSHTRFWGVLTPEILLSAVRMGRFDWTVAAKCAETARLVQGENAWPESFMHGLRAYTQHRPSPYRREPFEQLAGQLGRSLSFLSHQTTPPDSAMFYLAVYESAQGTGFLQQAFASLAEMGRPFVYQNQPTANQADSHKYKQCGNGVATPVAKWIAQHLKAVDG